MSKVFCDKPFNHNYIHMNGKVRLCCTTIQNIPTNDGYKLFDAGEHSIEEYWNSDRMKEIRLNMINGRETRDCRRCYEQEAKGLQSLRRTEGMADYIAHTLPDGTYTKSADSMQVQMGNICNLKCKMCGQAYSHMIGLELLEMGDDDPDFLLWVKEQGGIVNNWTNELGKKEQWFKNPDIKEKMFEHISKNIKFLCVIGGEPTLIPEFYELFEYCEKQGTLGDKTVTIVTNLTNTNPRMTQWLPKLKFWTIWASIDGLGERTEYIRYPSKWDNVIKNLNFYNDLAKGTKNIITLSPSIQLLNIDQLDDIIKWWLDFAGGQLNQNYSFSWLSQVWFPKICNFEIAPVDYKLKIADKLEQFKYGDPKYQANIDNLRTDSISDQERKHALKAFVKYNDHQDKFRKVAKTWRQLLPELEQSIDRELSK
jgi:sulfatase maturation enzyme AslB (radical SAM superfamily)